MWSQVMIGEYEEVSLPIAPPGKGIATGLRRTWQKFEASRGCCGVAFTPKQ
jgi:hypothetical protein